MHFDNSKEVVLTVKKTLYSTPKNSLNTQQQYIIHVAYE